MTKLSDKLNDLSVRVGDIEARRDAWPSPPEPAERFTSAVCASKPMTA